MRFRKVPEIDVGETARLAADDEVLLLDVRQPEEFEAGHAPGAVLVPLGELDATTVPRDRPIVVVCRSGNRSGTATRVLNASGLSARNLTGGMRAWAATGRPVVRRDGRPGGVA